jgi:S1-C subfamily serine protease
VELFEMASRSVVHIETSRVQRSRLSFNVFQIPQGTGSGFIWDAAGYVVTNLHVIKDADTADVILADGTRLDASLVGYAADYDLAVLKIAGGQGLRPLAVGTSEDLRVGQKVFAIGNPFGLDQTLTTGVISGLGREILSVTRTPIRGVIQTDAAINPGNSGGPLLDSAGRLIGVNTAIYSPSGASSGIGFAVPVDTVNAIVPQLIRSGKPERAGLGVVLASDSLARQRFGARGAMVLEVISGTGAQQAGLRDATRSSFDDIVELDGNPVQSRADVSRLLEGREVGDSVRVEFLRGGQRLEVDVVLSLLP